MIEFKYGLFSSFLLFIWLIFEYTLLLPKYYELSYYLSMIAVFIPAFGIYSGIKERKNKVNFGFISFKEAFKTGIIITIIISALVIMFIYIYYEYINPEFVNYLAAETEKTLLQENVNRDEINEAITVIRYRYSLNVQLISQLLFILIGGTGISFIVSVLLKKTKRHKSI